MFKEAHADVSYTCITIPLCRETHSEQMEELQETRRGQCNVAHSTFMFILN